MARPAGFVIPASVMTQRPFAHDDVEGAFVVQAVSHAPQCSGSLSMSTHAPPHMAGWSPHITAPVDVCAAPAPPPPPPPVPVLGPGVISSMPAISAHPASN